MADWIGINSSHYDSHCGDDGISTIEEALNGSDSWRHNANHTHWVIVDLGAIYNVQKVRGRSDFASLDPIDVNIYVSETNGDWGAAVATGITTWQDTRAWVEVDTTDKSGRYVKVEIIDTEAGDKDLRFGDTPAITIFDVYGEAAGNGSGQYFNGLIDNVMLFDTTLNIDEVKALYRGGHGTEIAEVIDLDRRFNSRRQ